MYVRLDNDINATDTIERNLLVVVIPPIAHSRHVCPSGFVLFVAFGEHDVFVEGGGKAQTLFGFLPGVVVDCGVRCVSWVMGFS